jgi:AraC-like DNA-binding protein
MVNVLFAIVKPLNDTTEKTCTFVLIMKLYIKNMVCNRCKMAVKSELEQLNLHPLSIELGEIELQEADINPIKAALAKNLQSLGFELIDDKKSQLISQIKSLIIDLVHHKNNRITVNLSDYLSKQLLQDYSSLSNLFSEVEGSTINKYYIEQKIEKVKELIIYDELTLKEIALLLNYSSVAHLSNQFKKVTGFSPSYYKNLKNKKRRQIDDL